MNYYDYYDYYYLGGSWAKQNNDPASIRIINAVCVCVCVRVCTMRCDRGVRQGCLVHTSWHPPDTSNVEVVAVPSVHETGRGSSPPIAPHGTHTHTQRYKQRRSCCRTERPRDRTRLKLGQLAVTERGLAGHELTQHEVARGPVGTVELADIGRA